MPTLDRHENVYVLDLGDGENRFHPDWITAVGAALDEVEKAEGPRALVTAATGKFWSNGLDLEWLFAHADAYHDYVVSVHELPRAAAVAAGDDGGRAPGPHVRGRGDALPGPRLPRDARRPRLLVPPEADIDIPFTPGMSALIRARLTPQTAHEAMTTARRYGGVDAAAASIVDRAVPEAEVRPTALSLAESLTGKAGSTLGTIKSRLYAEVLTTLRDRTNPLG